MTLVIGSPLFDYNFDTLDHFDSVGLFFDGVPVEIVSIQDLVSFQLLMVRDTLTQINIITATLKACFAHTMLSVFTTDDELKYTRKKGVVTRWKKSYEGFEKNQDSPTPLFGVS